MGDVLTEQAKEAGSADHSRLLEEAVAADRAALEVYTREQFARDWARTQCNLGRARVEQGKRATGADGQQWVRSAAAYRVAPEFYTREQWPKAWANTHEDLGVALFNQGVRATGADKPRLLGEAVAAYRAALDSTRGNNSCRPGVDAA